jgi:single-strand DNA-binding protein
MNKVKNSVRLSGFAGTDPVIIDFENNKRLATLCIAVHESFRNRLGELETQTQWINLAFWNKKVALVEGRVKKGTPLSVEGRLTMHRYTDKKGELRFATEIVVEHVEMTAELVS